MTWNPYDNLPETASFAVVSNDVRDGEKMPLPQASGIFGAGGEDVSPHLLRLGGSLGTHFLGIRASAFPALIDLPEYTATDSAIGEQLHGRLAAYAVWPSVARQAPGVSEVSGGGACPDEWWAVRSRPAC